jgi:xanthine dehydrogenase YagS FAD-binding subunit
MRPFDYAAPAGLDETIALLGAAGARPLAGGTDLIPLIKADILAPERLVSLRKAELPRGVEERDGALRLGALTTLSEIERHAAVQERAAALAEAAGLAATPQLRNRATIGGNLLQRPRCWYFRDSAVECWLKGGDRCPARDGENQQHALFDVSPCVAVHPSDLASALVALDAQVLLRGPAGERALPIEAFFAPPEEGRRRETTESPDELVLAVELPPQGGLRSTYLKAMDRKVWAFALVGAAVALRQGAGGAIEHARVVLSGVAPTPWRCAAAEEALLGQAPSEELFARAAEAALAGARPLDQNGYKLPLAKALVRRALAALAG